MLLQPSSDASNHGVDQQDTDEDMPQSSTSSTFLERLRTGMLQWQNGQSSLHHRGMAVKLLRAWQGVVGCKEAMWQESRKGRRDSRGDLLETSTWSRLESEMTPRQRFELLFERYEKEMRSHTAFSMAAWKGMGWEEPGNEISKSRPSSGFGMDLEQLTKERIALSQSAFDDLDPNLQVRYFIGFKGENFA